MEEIVVDENFNVEKLTKIIETQISQWKYYKITLNEFKWDIFDYENNLQYSYTFNIRLDDIDARIKIEDLRLNIIHYIESLKDDTTYEYFL